MIAPRRSRLFLPSALGALCLALAWFVYDGLSQGPQAHTMAADTSGDLQLPEVPPAQSFSMPPPDRFAAIVERPIFSPDRRPVRDIAIGAAPSNALNLSLVGVIISADQAIAIVSEHADADPVRLSEGDEFVGWTVAAIEPDRVTFRRGDVQEQIHLLYEQPPPQGQSPTDRRNARSQRLSRQRAEQPAPEDAQHEEDTQHEEDELQDEIQEHLDQAEEAGDLPQQAN